MINATYHVQCIKSLFLLFVTYTTYHNPPVLFLKSSYYLPREMHPFSFFTVGERHYIPRAVHPFSFCTLRERHNIPRAIHPLSIVTFRERHYLPRAVHPFSFSTLRCPPPLAKGRPRLSTCTIFTNKRWGCGCDQTRE